MVITISGLPGAGTSTVARLAADALDLECVVGGTVFRMMASDRSLDVGEFSKVAEGDPQITREIAQNWLSPPPCGEVPVPVRRSGFRSVDLRHRLRLIRHRCLG